MIPSRKTIKNRLDWLDKTNVGVELGATLVHQTLEYAEYGSIKQTLRRYLDKYSLPRIEYVNMYTKRSALIDSAFNILDHILETFGCEYISSSRDNYFHFCGIEYLNTGDTYTNTIVYDHGKCKWVITSWGQIIESESKRFENED